MIPQSVFGGRPIFYDGLRGVADPMPATAYTYGSTNANFTVARGAAQSTLIMLAVDTNGGYTDGQAIRVNQAAGPDMELLFLWKVETSNERLPGIWLRGDGTYASPVLSRDASCYWLEIDSWGPNLRLVRSVAGAGTVVISAASAWTDNTDTFLRFAGIGNRFYARAWPAANPEPNTWQINTTDTTLTTGTRFGFGLNGGSSGTSDYSGLFKGFWAWDLNTPLGAVSR